MFRPYIVVLAFLFIPLFANGQSAGIQLRATPAYPESAEAYTLSVADASFQNRSSITWFIDGIEATQFKNSSTLEIKEGNSPKQVTVRVVYTNGTVREGIYKANPYRIDLVAHADTTVPLFYKGRALPSSGSPITVTALVFKDGGASSNGYSYIWKVGGKVQNGGGLWGNNTVTYTPQFETELSVSVDVLDKTGAILSSESLQIPIAEPELYFYEVNPLRGLSEKALAEPFIFIGDEVRLRAEPYFMSKLILDEHVYAQWEINGKNVPSASDDKSEIIVQKQGISGSSVLSFHIRNMQQLLQGAKDKLTIRF